MTETTTPIIPGFHPDPSICRVGEQYWLVNSTFEYCPGVPVFTSTDLVSWQQVGNVLDRPSQLQVPTAKGSGGIFAPTIRHHDGVFFMVTTNIDQVMQGQLIVHADDAAGPWSEPVFVEGTGGIDPDLFWDADGRCRLTWCAGDQGIKQVIVDPLTGERLSEPISTWGGTGLANPEGPHLYRREGWYYLMLAEGGTERGHAVTIARSRSVDGPWESNPANPILSHRSTAAPVQNTGHADVVELADGSWAIVFLGVRPVGPTPKFHLLGRETFVAGIDWVDDWPVVDEARYQVMPGSGAVAEDFTLLGSLDALDAGWVAPGRFPSEFATVTPDGLQLALAPAAEQSSLLCRRVEHLSWQASADLDRGRLTLRLDHAHWAGVELANGMIRARLVVGPLNQVFATTPAPPEARPAMRATPAQGTFVDRSDTIELGYLAGGDFVALAAFDGRYLSTEVAGLFTGRMVGVEPVGEAPSILRGFEYIGS